MDTLPYGVSAYGLSVWEKVRRNNYSNYILELRDELYCVPYSEVDWKKARDTCAQVCIY